MTLVMVLVLLTFIINGASSPGTELCTVVETMYSYEVLFNVQGDSVFGEGCGL